jgi:hypothetical protein
MSPSRDMGVWHSNYMNDFLSVAFQATNANLHNVRDGPNDVSVGFPSKLWSLLLHQWLHMHAAVGSTGDRSSL